MAKTGKKIPIKVAKLIGEEKGYTQVVIHAYDGETGTQTVTTWGRTLDDCENAAKGGNKIKELLNWPKHLQNAQPKRTKQFNYMENALIEIDKIMKDSSLTSLNARNMIVKKLREYEDFLKTNK